VLFDGGKVLMNLLEPLDALAAALELQPLGAFYSLSHDEVIAWVGRDGEEYVAEHEGDADEDAEGWSIKGLRLWSREPRWFSPSPARETTTALLAHLRSEPSCLEVPDNGKREALLQVLVDLDVFLARMEANGKRFHLMSAF
jgi:hypothetical protein